MLTPHHPGLNALTAFMAATSIQKLQSQLAPAQFSQEDQASCYMGSVMLWNAPAEPTKPMHVLVLVHKRPNALAQAQEWKNSISPHFKKWLVGNVCSKIWQARSNPVILHIKLCSGVTAQPVKCLWQQGRSFERCQELVML